MGLVIHCVVRVEGSDPDLNAFRSRLAETLPAECPGGEWSDERLDHALRYVLKLPEGIPFPLFVKASEALPKVAISAEWVNVEQGIKGKAILRGGQLISHDEAALEGYAGPHAGTYLEADAEGRLRLAMVAVPVDDDEYRGYAACAGKDAFFHARRSGSISQILTTAGDEETWLERWTLDPESGSWRHQPMNAQQLARDEIASLLQLGHDFAADWLWFEDGPEQETAIERERFQRKGWAISKANVRSAKLAALSQNSDGRWVLDTLPDAASWVRDALRHHWSLTF